ncbi:hypothetical protein HMSSN036_61990 [Paenibacillus macerans]|nr:hypothetical protein HMSSN036_61990 [Paenibacillus macerans]
MERFLVRSRVYQQNGAQTLPLAIANFADGYQTDYGLTLAAMTLSVLPTIALYLLFQEQMMKGMTAGAVKG